MVDQIGLAGTIGTWIAVFIAIVALIGIVGPLLIWRASRSERYRALAAVDAGLADNGGFISKGIHLGPNIHLFRRVKAPVLTTLPPVGRVKLSWDTSVPQVSQASVSWVKLALMLKAYHIYYSRGDVLIVDQQRTFLPANRVWILVLGLVGRFGNRKDKGKLPKLGKKGIVSSQAVPGFQVGSRGSTSPRGRRRPQEGWETGRTDWARTATYDPLDSYSENEISYKPLHGLVGTLYLQRDKHRRARTNVERVLFDHHTQLEIGELQDDRLRIDGLFWLAVGCLPSEDGRVYSLENVQFNFYEQEDDVITPVITGGAPYTPSPAVHFQDNDQNDGDSIDNFPGYGRGYPRNSDTMAHIPTPNTYVSPLTPHPSTRDFYGSRGFKFSVTNERVDAFHDIVEAIGAEREGATVQSLEEVELSEDDNIELKNLAGVTYVPAASKWIRLTARITGTDSGAWFLQRSDAQALAQALLHLPICEKGYLFNTNKSSLCREALCSASENLPQLLIRITHMLDVFQLPDGNRGALLATMQQMLARVLKFDYNRAFSATIYQLDKALQDILPQDEMIVDAIGVLMITNNEFRDLMSQSIRHVEASINQTIGLDLATPSIDLKVVLGIVQKFPVDLAHLFPGFVPEERTIQISYTDLMMIVLKASLRSAFLKTSLNSLPLFEKVMDMDDTVHIG